MSSPVNLYAIGSEHPADLLNNAAAVTCFLKDVSGAITDPENDLCHASAHGLFLILAGIETTISHAVAQIAMEPAPET